MLKPVIFIADDWYSDPRLSDLGQRAVLQKDSSPVSDDASEADPADFQLWRIQQGVAEGDIEMPSGVAAALYLNAMPSFLKVKNRF